MFSLLWRFTSFIVATYLKITIALTRSIHLTMLNICDIFEDCFELRVKKSELQGASLDVNTNAKQIEAKIINFSDLANFFSQITQTTQTDNVTVSLNEGREKNPNTDVIICNLDTSKKVIITHRDLNCNISKEKLDRNENSGVEVKCKKIEKIKDNLPIEVNNSENVHPDIHSTYCLYGDSSESSSMSIENDVSNSEIVMYPQNSTFLKQSSDDDSKKLDSVTNENYETQNKQQLDCKKSETQTKISSNHHLKSALCTGAKVSSSNPQENSVESGNSLSELFVQSQFSNAMEFMNTLKNLLENFHVTNDKQESILNDARKKFNLNIRENNQIEKLNGNISPTLIRENHNEEEIISCNQEISEYIGKPNFTSNGHFHVPISSSNQEHGSLGDKNDNLSSCNSDEFLSNGEERHKLNSTLLGEISLLNDSIKHRLSTSGFSTANEAVLNFKKIQNEIKGTLKKTSGHRNEAKEIKYACPQEMHYMNKPEDDFREMLSCSSYESLPVSDHIRNALDKSQRFSLYKENCTSSSTRDFSSVDDFLEAFKKIKSTLSVSEFFERRSSGTFSFTGSSESEISKLNRAQSCEFIQTEMAEKNCDNLGNITKGGSVKLPTSNIAKNQSLTPLIIKTNYTKSHELPSLSSPATDILLESDQSKNTFDESNNELHLTDSSDKSKSYLTSENINQFKYIKSEKHTQNSPENKAMFFPNEVAFELFLSNKSDSVAEIQDKNVKECDSSDCTRKDKQSLNKKKSNEKTENSKYSPRFLVDKHNSTSKSKQIKTENLKNTHRSQIDKHNSASKFHQWDEDTTKLFEENFSGDSVENYENDNINNELVKSLLENTLKSDSSSDSASTVIESFKLQKSNLN